MKATDTSEKGLEDRNVAAMTDRLTAHHEGEGDATQQT